MMIRFIAFMSSTRYRRQPSPSNLNSSKRWISKLLESPKTNVYIASFATDTCNARSAFELPPLWKPLERTAIYNGQIKTISIADSSDLVMAERVGIRIGANRYCVKDDVADGNNIISVRGGDTTGAESWTIVCQIACVCLRS